MKAESFGYKSAWVAAKNRSPEAVAQALGLRDVRPSAWEAGVEAAQQYPITCSVFVTPPIDGWVLCVGYAFNGPTDAQPPTFGELAAAWAAHLDTEVQYFATQRVVEAHAWARARPSGLERAYSYLGESGQKLLDVGPPTPEERDLGFAFFDPKSPEAENDGYWEREDLTHVSEEHVMMLAARWSVDPSSLGERDLDVGEGLVGEFGEPRPLGTPEPPPKNKAWWKLW